MSSRRTVSQIVDEMKFDIMRRNPQLSYWGPLSVIRTIVEAFAVQLYEVEKEIERTERVLFIDSATGSDLDRLIKDRLPEGRHPGTKASGIVVFSRDTPATSDITIPAGTRLAAVHPTMDTIYFVTTEDAIIAVGETSVSTNAVAEKEGINGNVVAYAINHMVSTIPGVVRVENPYPFTGGSNEESDDDLRKRYMYTVNVPGRATANMIEQHLKDDAMILEARCYNVGGGEVEIIVDCAEPSEERFIEVSEKIEENIAAGIVSRGLYAAIIDYANPMYELGDSDGGYIWLRAERMIPNDETITIYFKDKNGETQEATVIIPRNTPKGFAIKAQMPQGKLATSITGSSTVQYSYTALIGLGEYPYLFNLPETVLVTVTISITPTDTPEKDLDKNIEASVTNFLNSFSIGESLEFSDLAQYVYFEYGENGRKFVGIDTVNSILISGNNTSINSYGEKIEVEPDQRIRAGSVTVSMV